MKRCLRADPPQGDKQVRPPILAENTPSLLVVGLCTHTDILVSLPHTDILVSLGVTVSGAPDSGGAQTGGRGKSADVARQGTRGERRDRSGVVDSGSALYPTAAVHAPTRVPSATHFLRTAAPYSSALHRLCLLAV